MRQFLQVIFRISMDHEAGAQRQRGSHLLYSGHFFYCKRFPVASAHFQPNLMDLDGDTNKESLITTEKITTCSAELLSTISFSQVSATRMHTNKQAKTRSLLRIKNQLKMHSLQCLHVSGTN